MDPTGRRARTWLPDGRRTRAWSPDRGAALRSRLAWAAGPALRAPWLLSLLVVMAGAVAAATAVGYQGGGPLLLALAPALPLAGVAVSYGPYADPMHEITAATPAGGLRLLLLRTAVVLATAIPLVTIAGLVLPSPPDTPGPWAWLLPGLALTTGALWLGSYTGCRAACALLGGGWLLTVAAQASGRGLPTDERLAAALATLTTSPAAQGAWGAGVVVAGGLLAVRRQAFDRVPFQRLGGS